MQALLKAFWDIALWRRDPSHLPDSPTLVLLAGLAYAALSAVQSWLIYGTDALVLRTMADLGLSCLKLALSSSRRSRAAQDAPPATPPTIRILFFSCMGISFPGCPAGGRENRFGGPPMLLDGFQAISKK